MRGVRVAIVIGLCALGCAKRPGDATIAPDRTAAPEHEELAKDSAPLGGAEGRNFEAEVSPTQIEAPQTFEDLTAALDRHEAELRAEGVRLKTYRKDRSKVLHGKRTKPPPTTTTADAVGTKKTEDPCTRICAIATAVCELKTKICTLAAEHEDEPRYAATCKRATTDCTRATEACDECS